MESLYKNRFLFWILIFLIVVNLSALATYFLFPKRTAEVTCSSSAMEPGCALQAELNLSDEQISLVDKINSEYEEVSKPISGEIKSRRAAILDELVSDNPDTLNINQLCLEISRMQNQLHRENIRHYLELKKVCNPGQAMRLSNLYRDLYGCPMQGQGNGIRNRHRKGM